VFSSIRKVAAGAMLAVALISISGSTGVQAQRPRDREVRQSIHFARGSNSAIIRQRIQLGTTHTYSLRAAAGQRMQVVLTTRGRTSFTVYTPQSGILEDADGVKKYVGDLQESGEYLISIGTDDTATYTLEVAIV
jgi:hypothetical protein